jgi:predicted MFS family arabinose efflux permease
MGVISLVASPMLVGLFVNVVHLSEAQAGHVVSADLLGLALSTLASGSFGRRLSTPRVALTALGIFVVANLATLAASSYTELLAVRLCAGLAGGVELAIAYTTLGSHKNPDRVFGFFLGGQTLLAVLVLSSFQPLITRWQLPGAFVGIALLGLCGIPFALRLHPPDMASSHIAIGSNSLRSSHKICLLGLFSVTLFFIVQGGIWAYFERIGDYSRLSPDFIGRFLALSMGISFLGPVIASILSTRFGRLPPFLMTLLFQVGALALLQGDISPWSYAIAVSVFVFFWNYINAYQAGAIAAVDASGRYVVLVATASALGLAIGPSLAGPLIEGRGIAPLLNAGMALCVVSFLMMLPVLWYARQ